MSFGTPNRLDRFCPQSFLSVIKKWKFSLPFASAFSSGKDSRKPKSSGFFHFETR
jgi:hypothetical protein